MKNSFIIDSAEGNKILCDLTTPLNGYTEELVIFVHGFKGFKDWGTHNLVADYFASHGLAYLKFNFSHNGTTIDDPTNFADLEAFGRNTFSKELSDLNAILDFTFSNKEFTAPRKLYLLGHSRGGGISILLTSRDSRVDKLVTWASVAYFNTLFLHNDIEEWRKTGVITIENSRTKQQMPLYSTLLDDYEQNADGLNVNENSKKISVPWLIVHGDADPTVNINHAKMLHEHSNSELLVVENGDHVFGASHPFKGTQLPQDLQKVCDATIEFFKRVNQ
ncbi:prolyl oligopeptidase family serine peptidase [Pedobacter sp. HMF7647]|uniref:Prolyl oligopeptidase family serine peptidase n=1 Tax=Hufsiella arboris TaxID=2695275 RepID=A0A7K1YE80_9SPHI|nr:alpha/beta fold hydrolase [Hufsiella arboris]MXV52710.1 prolyl oligopeptidase family serine peptidase [Hufsiella arboris]